MSCNLPYLLPRHAITSRYRGRSATRKELEIVFSHSLTRRYRHQIRRASIGRAMLKTADRVTKTDEKVIAILSTKFEKNGALLPSFSRTLSNSVWFLILRPLIELDSSSRSKKVTIKVILQQMLNVCSSEHIPLAPVRRPASG